LNNGVFIRYLVPRDPEMGQLVLHRKVNRLAYRKATNIQECSI
jgi:hypothetical protein